MVKKIVGMLVVVFLFCGLSFGLGMIGNPSDTLDKDTFSLGYDYANTEQDIKVFGTSKYDGIIKDVESTSNIGILAYGVTDNFAVFGKVGQVGIESSKDTDGLLGLGAKVNILDWGNLSLGASAEANYFRTSVEVPARRIGSKWCYRYTEPEYYDIDAVETFVTLAPAYKVTDELSVYGGPAIYMLNGDIETTSSTFRGTSIEDGSIKEVNSVLGFVGVTYKVFGVDLAGEYQFASEYQTIGFGAQIKF